MPRVTLHISTRKVLEFADHCIKNNEYGITNFSSFCQRIEYPPTNTSNLKRGEVNLTPLHLERVALEFGLNMNWIFGFSDQMHMEKQRKPNPIKQLKDAVNLIEAHLNKIVEKQP